MEQSSITHMGDIKTEKQKTEDNTRSAIRLIAAFITQKEVKQFFSQQHMLRLGSGFPNLA